MKKLEKSTLKELSEQKGNPCISLIVSTEIKSFTDKEKIQLKLKNNVKQLEKALLKDNYPQKIIDQLIQSLESLTEQFRPDHLQAGAGFYVSPGFAKLVSFPFPVKENIIINSSFDVSEIKDALDKMKGYLVLQLSKNKTGIYQGEGKTLNEINDDYFPRQFENEFQVHRTDPHSFYNDEESKIDQSRLESYFREVDQMLSPYLGDRPMIVLGVTKHLSSFRAVSKHKNLIIAEIEGNFDKQSLYEIAQKVWPKVEDNLSKD